MTILTVILLATIVCFSFVLLFGAPYLPTMSKQVDVGLDLLDLKPGQTMLELGCGDGKMLIAAAKRGWSSVGYELNPILFCIAWLRTRRHKQVRVVWCDYWRVQWPPAAGVYGFILDSYMKKLDNKIIQDLEPPVKLVSLAFKIPGKKTSVQKNGFFLYLYK